MVLLDLDCPVAHTGGMARTETCEPIGADFTGGNKNVSGAYGIWAAWLGLTGVRRRWRRRVGKDTE